MFKETYYSCLDLDDYIVYINIFLKVLIIYRIIPSRKAPGVLFILVRSSMGHTQFQNNELHIFWEPKRPTLVFSSFRIPESLQLEFDTSSFGLEKKPTFDLHEAYLCTSLYLSFISCIQVVFTT